MSTPRVPSLAALAREMLGPTAGKARSHQDMERAIKRFRKIGEVRFRMLHRAGGGGVEVCEKRAGMVDLALTYLWEHLVSREEYAAASKTPMSLVATGGYGREQMNPGSDVDMLFLMSGNTTRVPATVVGSLVTQFLTMLWDTGFKVGDSSTRSVGDTISQANADNQVKTALIEARIVAGAELPFSQLKKRFDRECMKGHESEFLRLRQEDLRERHAKHENTPFVQEPNVKTGCGGLRDYHNLLWTAYAKERTTRLRDLLKSGFLTKTSLRELTQAHEFLLRTRTEMHYIEKREHDLLTLRLQGTVATNLGYRQKRMLERIEAFMRDYYTHTRNILQRGNELMDRFHLDTLEQEQRGMRGFLARRRASKEEKFDGFISKNDRLYPENDAIFIDDPTRLMRMFIHTQQRHLRFSPELYRLVQKNYGLINQTFRYSKAVRESFEAILSCKGDVARVLRQMHRVDFIGRYLPEFGALTCLVQHEFFHRYTADEHTLRTIDKLDDLAGPPRAGMEFYQKIFREMQEPGLLYLALLLHDTGRAANALTHSDESANLASRVCRRLQIKGERRRLLMFLVDHHLTLFKFATTKNLDDPQVIEDFAQIARTQSFLDALMVMSCADSQGTSEQSWTNWKESLLRQLYSNAQRYLDNPTDFTRSISAPLEVLQTEVMELVGEGYEQETAAHFAHMPRGYFNFRDAPTVARHLRLFRNFFCKLVEDDANTGLLPTLEWDERPEQGCSVLNVVCWDRHLLLARVSGALAANNINILSADFFQRTDDVVLDIFRVCTPHFTPITNERTKARVQTMIEQAFQSTHFDFSEPIAQNRRSTKGHDDVASELPQRIYLNNELSPNHTVLELQAIDRIGLLHDVFMAIGQLGVSICHARINTEKGVAFDALYLQNNAEQKITDRDLLLKLREDVDRAVFF